MDINMEDLTTESLMNILRFLYGNSNAMQRAHSASLCLLDGVCDCYD